MKSVNCHSSWFLTAVCHCVCLDHLQTFSLVPVSWGVSRPRLTPERSTFAEGWKSGWSWTGVPAWRMDSEEGVISVTKLTGLVAAVQCVQAETMTDAVTGLRRWRRNGCRWNWNKSGQSCVMSCVQCITLTTVTMLTHLTATEWHGLSAGKCHCVLVMLVVVVTIIVVVAHMISDACQFICDSFKVSAPAVSVTLFDLITSSFPGSSPTESSVWLIVFYHIVCNI